MLHRAARPASPAEGTPHKPVYPPVVAGNPKQGRVNTGCIDDLSLAHVRKGGMDSFVSAVRQPGGFHRQRTGRLALSHVPAEGTRAPRIETKKQPQHAPPVAERPRSAARSHKAIHTAQRYRQSAASHC